MKHIILFYLLPYLSFVAIGYGLYKGLFYLPDNFRAKLKERKTFIFSAIALAAPEVANILSSIDSLGLIDYAPTAMQKYLTQGFGVLMIVARLWTMQERSEE